MHQLNLQEYDGSQGNVRNKPLQRTISIMITALILLLILITPLGGALLNRGRGGLVNMSEMEYWTSHVLSRVLFAIPTGILMGIVAVNLRASVLISLLTWSSLYVGWGTYMSLGHNHDSLTVRTGVFDWLLGRQDAVYDHTLALTRDYVGMSLRGLIWTFPCGYLLNSLGFGTTYAVTGSLMGLAYFAGSSSSISTNDKYSCSGIACAEYYWGFWIWFVLLVVSLCHFFDFPKNNTTDFMKKNRLFRYYRIFYIHKIHTVLFELLAGVFSIILLTTVVFYAIVEQPDLRNKGQTFFGLITNCIVLLTSQAFRAGRFVEDNFRNTQTAPYPVRNESLYRSIQIVDNGDTSQPLLEPKKQNEMYCLKRYKYYIHSFQKLVYIEAILVVRMLVDLLGLISILFLCGVTIYAVYNGWDEPRFKSCVVSCRGERWASSGNLY